MHMNAGELGAIKSKKSVLETLMMKTMKSFYVVEHLKVMHVHFAAKMKKNELTNI